MSDDEMAGNETGNSRVAIRNPALVTRVLELRKQGHDISQIARELQLSRPTVRKYLATAGEIATSYQEQIDAITQAALDSIKAQILDRRARRRSPRPRLRQVYGVRRKEQPHLPLRGRCPAPGCDQLTSARSIRSCCRGSGCERSAARAAQSNLVDSPGCRYRFRNALAILDQSEHHYRRPRRRGVIRLHHNPVLSIRLSFKEVFVFLRID